MAVRDDRDSSTVTGYRYDCKAEVVKQTFWGEDADKKAVALRETFAHEHAAISWDISSYSTVYVK